MIRAFATSVLSALLLAGCATTSPSPSADPFATAVLPSASPLAAPTPSAVPSPPPETPSPTPASSPWTSSATTLAWQRLGSIQFSCDHCIVGPVDGELNGLVGFEDGYVVLDGRAGAVWHSSDGRAWKRVRLPIEGSRAEARDANGLLGRAIATNGSQVLVVGGYSHPPCGLTEPGSTGGGPDCSYSPIAWISDDGVSWRLVYPDAGGEFVAAWPVASGGWVAAASEWSGVALDGRTLWRSADGIAWKRDRPRPPVEWGYDRAPVRVGNDAERYLLAAGERGGDRAFLAARTDGGRWRVVRGFPGRRTDVVAGVAPTGGRGTWVLAGRSGRTYDCEGALGDDCWGVPTVWSSADGVDWATTRPPVGRGVEPEDPEGDDPVQVTAVTSLALTDRGYVAVGAEGNPGVGARHETWVSDDGVTWTRLPQAGRPRFDHGPGLVAEGPAGLIGISGSEGDELVVWQLR